MVPASIGGGLPLALWSSRGGRGIVVGLEVLAVLRVGHEVSEMGHVVVVLLVQILLLSLVSAALARAWRCVH